MAKKSYRETRRFEARDEPRTRNNTSPRHENLTNQPPLPQIKIQPFRNPLSDRWVDAPRAQTAVKTGVKLGAKSHLRVPSLI